mmetsp:Transcript_26031/g.66089  ORF Transcript_26031/g.66089 Transcript_26031/m.66089 type:complete len:239 (+) Transcript_26031:74-790(+)
MYRVPRRWWLLSRMRGVGLSVRAHLSRTPRDTRSRRVSPNCPRCARCRSRRTGWSSSWTGRASSGGQLQSRRGGKLRCALRCGRTGATHNCSHSWTGGNSSLSPFRAHYTSKSLFGRAKHRRPLACLPGWMGAQQSTAATASAPVSGVWHTPQSWWSWWSPQRKSNSVPNWPHTPSALGGVSPRVRERGSAPPSRCWAPKKRRRRRRAQRRRQRRRWLRRRRRKRRRRTSPRPPRLWT